MNMLDQEIVRVADSILDRTVQFYEQSIEISHMMEDGEWMRELFVNFKERLEDFLHNELEELKGYVQVIYPFKDKKVVERSCVYAFARRTEELKHLYNKIWARRIRLISLTAEAENG